MTGRQRRRAQCAAVAGRRVWPARCAVAAAVLVGCWLRSLSTLAVAPADEVSAGAPSELEALLRSDGALLKDGETIRGKLIERTGKRLVFLVGTELRTAAAADVERVSRGAPRASREHFRARYRAVRENPNVKGFRELAAWAREREEEHGENLTPERGLALRAVLRLAPEDADAERDRREVLFHGGKWYTLRALAEYALRDGELVRKSSAGDSTTATGRTSTGVRQRSSLLESYRLLERQALSAPQLERLEQEMATRIERAREARESQDLEYEGVDWVDRHRITTKHFEIHCNSTYRVARLYGDLMEIIRAELSRMFHSPIVRTLRAPVFIYKSQEEFLEQDDFGRYGGRGIGGYYVQASQKVVAFHGTFGFTGTTFSVLCHEGTHYYEGLVLKDFSNVPVWLIEGLAVYFGDGSTFDARKRKIRVGQIPRDRLVHIQEKIDAGRHTDVRTLVNMKRWGRNPFTGSHYADAWALIYFLVNSGGSGQSLLEEYWSIGIQRLLTQEDFEGLAKKHFGSTSKLEDDYIKYISDLQLPAAGEVKGDYFITERFRFLVKRPGADWEFFVDSQDKRMLVGLLLPGSDVEVRVYYDNNQLNQEAEVFMRSYTKLLDARHGRFDGPDKILMSGLDAYKLRYLDDGETPEPLLLDVSGGVVTIHRTKRPEKKEKRFEGPRDIAEYKLVLIDGVATIECSTPPGERARHLDVFERVAASFVLDTTRRW